MAETPGPSRSHFFAGTPVSTAVTPHIEEVLSLTPTRPSGSSTKVPLFFNDSDDEDIVISHDNEPPASSPPGDLIDAEVDLNLPVTELDRASSVSSVNS